jgi:hypothetical protein
MTGPCLLGLGFPEPLDYACIAESNIKEYLQNCDACFTLWTEPGS